MVGSAVALWLVLVATGWCMMMQYSLRGEAPADASRLAPWPAASQLPHEAGRPTLVVFLHPMCPCSQATLSELERVVYGPQPTAARAPLVVVVAVTPTTAESDWVNSPLIERARHWPKARVFIDQDGVEAERFSAAASGTVLFFDAAGVRRFAGGVTSARGHEGSNAGGDALASLLSGGFGPIATFPTFGCRLIAATR